MHMYVCNITCLLTPHGNLGCGNIVSQEANFFSHRCCFQTQLGTFVVDDATEDIYVHQQSLHLLCEFMWSITKVIAVHLSAFLIFSLTVLLLLWK